MEYGTCPIPVTRWKPRTRGIKPTVAPMTKAVDCTPKRDAKALAGCLTQPMATAMVPHLVKPTTEQLLQYTDSILQVWAGLESWKVTAVSTESVPECEIVPRGTFIGPMFERTVRVPIKSVGNSIELPASSKQASSIGNF